MSRVYINQSEFQDLGPQYNSVAHNIGSINGQIREISHNLEMELGAEEAILSQSEQINLELEKTEQNLIDYSEFFNESYEEYEELDNPSSGDPIIGEENPGFVGGGTTPLEPIVPVIVPFLIPIIFEPGPSIPPNPGATPGTPGDTPGTVIYAPTTTTTGDTTIIHDNKKIFIEYIDRRTFGARPTHKCGRCAPTWRHDLEPKNQSRIRRRLPYGYQRPKAHLSSNDTVNNIIDNSNLKTDKSLLDNIDPVSLLMGAGGLAVVVGLPLLINSLTNSNRKKSEPQWAPQYIQSRPPINQRVVPSSNLSQKGWQ